MWNSYFSYLDYLELRRRVERRLSGSLWLFIHVALFVIIPQACYGLWPWGWWYPGYTLVHDWIAAAMIGWSIILLLHGLWTFFRSGAWGGRRSQVIETEMRERVRSDDSYLTQDSRDLFRLHGLLEEDVRRRSGMMVVPLTLFTVINAVLWIAEQGGLYDALVWWMPVTMSLFLLPILMVNRWQLRRHEGKLRDLLASGEALSAVKPKREALRFAGDDELLDIIQDGEYEKPKWLTR